MMVRGNIYATMRLRASMAEGYRPRDYAEYDESLTCNKYEAVPHWLTSTHILNQIYPPALPDLTKFYSVLLLSPIELVDIALHVFPVARQDALLHEAYHLDDCPLYLSFLWPYSIFVQEAHGQEWH